MVRRISIAAAAFVAALACAAAFAGGAAAHPLGNFTVNRLSEIHVSGNRVYVLYVLDMAEIPTFQARQSGVDAAAYARRIAQNARLTVDGRPVALMPVRHVIAFPKGQGGLHTMRLEVVLRGPQLDGAPASLAYRDANYGDRIGWKEVVLLATSGASVSSSSVPTRSASNGLRAYPKDLLHSPLDVTSATATVRPGSAEGPAPAPTGGTALQAPDRVADSGFSSLVARGKLSAGVILVSLLIAAFWGAAHALTPGHGKALVAGYLVGTKGTPRHAVLLGATVTVTHTAGVFGFGLVTLALSRFIVPETLYPWLTLVSGLLVVGVGAAVLRARLRSGSWGHGHSHGPDGHHHHDHRHQHHHDHDHGHDHHGHHDHDDEALTNRGILGVGIAAGILPCPSALVVLLSAIALHRVGFGLALITAFSLGLACTVTGIGLAAVLARRMFSRVSLEGRVVKTLPALSALVILCVGVAITVRALPGVV
jgi:nickel/cobalt transporter (NicO) family protein